MVKDFDKWNKDKKILDTNSCEINFHEREIWWCSIGINIGYEQHSDSQDFSRPVLVLKKFTRDIFWGIPMTTKVKNLRFRFKYKLQDTENDLLILQMRTFDRKRLVRKIAVMSKERFKGVLTVIKSII